MSQMSGGTNDVPDAVCACAQLCFWATASSADVADGACWQQAKTAEKNGKALACTCFVNNCEALAQIFFFKFHDPGEWLIDFEQSSAQWARPPPSAAVPSSAVRPTVAGAGHNLPVAGQRVVPHLGGGVVAPRPGGRRGGGRAEGGAGQGLGQNGRLRGRREGPSGGHREACRGGGRQIGQKANGLGVYLAKEKQKRNERQRDGGHWQVFRA